MTLSIVIPTHDTQELTLRCLESISRSAPAAEVILVDDASSDGTAETAAKRYPALQILRCPEPIGFTRAANLGMSRAHGEILLLLNSDTEVDPAGPEALSAAFAADARLGAAGATLHYPDGSPQWSAGRVPSLPWLFGLASGAPAIMGRLPFYRRLKPPGGDPGGVEWVTGAALALRRTAWDDVGPFDEAFLFYGQDLDLCLRLRAAGWRVALLPEFRVLHHHGATIRETAKSGGSRQDPKLLWTDLLYWARKHRGRRWARSAALTLAAGGCLRLLARSLLAPLQPSSERRLYRQESQALRSALRSVLHRHRDPSAPEMPVG